MSDETVYQQYADAASTRDLKPTALTLLSRSQLLQYLQSSEELNRVKEVRTRRTVIGPGKHWSHERLEDLKPVTLAVGGGLMSDQVGRGKCSQLIGVCLIESSFLLPPPRREGLACQNCIKMCSLGIRTARSGGYEGKGLPRQSISHTATLHFL